VRVLEGPNLYFPRPAVKVTLALPGYLEAPVDTLRALSSEAGLRRGQPGAPGSEQRQQVLLRLVVRVARAEAPSCRAT
jgi:cyanophycin synthetase